MKRKEYKTGYERKADQRAGFIVFPIVNGLIWLTALIMGNWFSVDEGWMQVLPWIINGIVLILGFALRPEFAVGYISFIAIAFIAVIVLGVLFIGGCFVAIGIGLVFYPLGGDLTNIMFLLSWAVILLVGFIWLVGQAIQLHENWWHGWETPDDSNPSLSLRKDQLPDALNQSAESWFNQPSEDSPQQDNGENEK